MKKLLLALFVLATGFTVVACGVALTTTTTAEGTAFTDINDVYTFQAVSAAELLIGSQSNLVLASQPLSFSADSVSGPTKGNTTTTTTTEGTTSILDDATTGADDPIVTVDLAVLDQYLAMMEEFLGQDNGLSVTVEASDRAEYSIKITYVTRNLNGENMTYTLYFNEILYVDPTDPVDGGTTTTGTETTTEGETTTTEPETTTTEPETTTTEETTTTPLGQEEHERNFEFEDENDNEVVYSLSGILVVGDLTYNLEGKKVIEDNEEVMMLRAFVDHENYVKVRYQTDAVDGEQKFFYEVVTAGVILNKSKVQVSTETDGSIKTKLEFIEGDAKGKYEFTQEIDGNISYIKIKYETESAEGVEESGLIHITATYDEATGLTTYEYSVRPEGKDEHNYEQDREHHHGDQGGHQGEKNNDDADGTDDDDCEDPEDGEVVEG